MKKKIAIYGAGGLGREVLSLINALPGWEVTGFYDDGKSIGESIGQTNRFTSPLPSDSDLFPSGVSRSFPSGVSRLGDSAHTETNSPRPNSISVSGSLSELLQVKEETHLVIAIGNPTIKKQLAEKLASNPFIHFPTLIHPNALIQDLPSVQMGNGCIITAGVILTTEITLGNHVLLNLNTTVGHDVHIGDYCSIMPGVNIAGEVKLGRATLIGSGANVLNGIHVGDYCRVGAGAVVTKDVHENSTVVGVPARPINDKS